MKMFFYGCGVIALLFGVVSFAAEPVTDKPEWESVLEKLDEQDSYKGEFTQERHLSILQMPLISKGHFAIDKDQTIQWQVNEPFSVAFSYHKNTLQQCTNLQDEKSCRKVSKTDDPMLHGFFSFFAKVFSGSNEELTNWFDIESVTDESAVLMHPKKAFLKKVFSSIRIEHDTKKVTKVVILETKQEQQQNADKQILSFQYQ
ncbi:LolA family protein [Teredinibacter sp. KSP-S5-2]|uniref:LolA family protein n=1 Tax=Teredinibacter sp. KSP-S5-2 TaxID=3034506 RepID=UPI0029340EC7|nr:LolA-related protein [Teredinibacter sp. KSP-S5-2]WNO09247.1 hypothetical protein P5V12_20095 [Teredinibacter sp. KSP-S5-2]